MKNLARLAVVLFFTTASAAFACTQPVSVCTKAAKTSFALISAGQPAAVLIEPSANAAVKLASTSFAADLERVSGRAPHAVSDVSAAQGVLVIAGVVGQSAAIDDLARAGKIDVADLAGQWEAYRQIVID